MNDIKQIAKDIITDERQVILKPDNWVQNALATDKDGCAGVDVNDDDAFCFCSIGAMMRTLENKPLRNSVAFNEGYNLAINILNKVMNNCIPDFNDTHTHEEVIAKFDEAINSL